MQKDDKNMPDIADMGIFAISSIEPPLFARRTFKAFPRVSNNQRITYTIRFDGAAPCPARFEGGEGGKDWSCYLAIFQRGDDEI